MSGPYADARPKDLQVPSAVAPRKPKKNWKFIRLEDKAYIVLDRQVFSATTQFYVTRHPGKRYGGNLINDGTGNFSVFFESSSGYYSEPTTLEPGAYLIFENYPLSGITLKGAGTYTLVAWAARSVHGYVRRIPAVTIASLPPVIIPTPVPVSQSGAWTVAVIPTPVPVSQSGAWTVAVTQSGAWTVGVNNFPVSPYDVSDRGGRLLGIVYGNLGQLDQRLIGGRNLATVALEAWLGSTAPTVGQKTMAASIPVTIASDQGPRLPVGVTTIFKSAAATGTNTTIYTVTGGKTFYLVGAGLSVDASAAGVSNVGTLEIEPGGVGGFIIFLDLIITNGAALAGGNAVSVPFTPAIPMPFPAGTIFQVRSYAVNLNAAAWIMGLEQ